MRSDSQIEKVAVVDDDQTEAQLMSEIVQEAGFLPVPVLATERTDRFDNPSVLAAVIQDRAEAAVCDHRLRPLGYASFDGAQLVAELLVRKIPAVLVTTYLDIDADVSIRRWRDKIPVLLSRDEADPEHIREGLEACLSEIAGAVLAGRRPRRALIRVVDVTQESSETVVDAIVPQWNPNKGVRFPVTLLPRELHSEVAPGIRLLADVNIGARKAEELFFGNFDLAPEPARENDVL